MSESEGGSGDVYEMGTLPTLGFVIWKMLLTVDFEVPIAIWFIFVIGIFVLLLHFRKQPKYAALIFLPVVAALGCTGRVNEYIVKNQLYSKLGFKKNNFDHAGVFMFMFWGIPLVIISSVFVLIFFVNVVRSAWDLWSNYKAPAAMN